MGMRGRRLNHPDDPVFVLVQEIPLSMSLHPAPMAKNELEQIHMDKFCTDHQLATGAEEECALRDHLLASHPKTVQPETLSVLLRHFVVIELPPPAA